MFSIITPSLNSADVITECINSVAEQGGEVEHLVIDGESRDSTQDLVAQLNEDANVLQEPARGIYAAINKGIQMAKGDIVGILHADDFFASSEVLGRVREVFEDKAVDACFGDLCYVDRLDPSRIVRYWQAGSYRSRKLHHGWMPPHPTFFVRRNLYEELGLYREDLGTAADYELMLRFLLRHQIRVSYIPKVLVNMRTGGASNASWSARFIANRMDRRAWEVNGLRPYPWTLAAKPLRKIPQWWRRPVQD